MSTRYTFKVVVAGDGGTGKTTLINRYMSNKFSVDTKVTIGAGFYTKTLEIKDALLKLQIWDFGGEKRFRFILPTYCKGAHGVIMAFDLTRLPTLVGLDEWIEIIRSNADNPRIILIGTKLDLGQSVDDETINEFLERNKAIASFQKTSSKTGENVEDVFTQIGNLLLESVEGNSNAQ
ncbi:MAG: Rab family GTPase [Promethearchaeota archaeon]